ncbi:MULTISPECIES: helix-turn-helix domain-containing protein [unclassified Nocardiopsis]|uniref:helix-turn-helix domain-containing protein n=1 Tax=unclassified Nocardiopsis TaxID=2649073 RepID=UPI0012E2D2F0|nr:MULTISPECIES: helix-turn-helix transcriptional regulator [unclassified Nocardiopsis]
MATRKTKFHGGSTKTVARNVRRFREAQGLSAAKLSARTAELGYEIPREGVQKIEAAADGRPGARHINADELVVLALALNTTPVALLLGTSDRANDTVEITGVGETTADQAWAWATGDAPALPRDPQEAPGEQHTRHTLYQAYGRPWWLPERRHEDRLRRAIEKHYKDRGQFDEFADEEMPPDGPST